MKLYFKMIGAEMRPTKDSSDCSPARMAALFSGRVFGCGGNGVEPRHVGGTAFGGCRRHVAGGCGELHGNTITDALPFVGRARRRVAIALRDGWILYCEGGNVQMRSQHGQERHGGPHGHGLQSVRHGESCGGQRRRAGRSILNGGGGTPEEDMV